MGISAAAKEKNEMTTHVPTAAVAFRWRLYMQEARIVEISDALSSLLDLICLSNFALHALPTPVFSTFTVQ